MQGAHVAEPAGDGQPRGCGQEAWTGNFAFLDGVADHDIEPRLGRRGADAACDAVVEIEPGVVHGEQGVLLGGDSPQRSQVVGVVDAQVRVRLDQARHQGGPVATVDDLCAVALQRFAVARNRNDLVALHQHFPAEGFIPAAVEHGYVCE